MTNTTDNHSTCDVLVIGAGVAGACAAVASAREGAVTLLVERNATPGGTGISAMHRTLCGLYAGGPETPMTTLNDGLAREISDALISRPPNGGPKRMGKVHVLPYRTPDLEAILHTLIENEPRLSSAFDTCAMAVESTGSRIAAVTLSTAGHDRSVKPRRVIDCTGDGSVLQWAGSAQAPTSTEDQQLAGFTIHVTGLSKSNDVLPVAVPYALRTAADSGELPDTMKYTVFYPGDSAAEGYCKLSIPPFPREGRAARARASAETVLQILTREVPAFREARIAATSPDVLEREGTRLQGLYVLTEEDVLKARSFPSSAARNAWPIETWLPATGPRYEYLEPGTSYDIPMDCLRSKSVENLYAAGRCISVTARALGSTRVMGPCITLGEAAGHHAAQNLRP